MEQSQSLFIIGTESSVSDRQQTGFWCSHSYFWCTTMYCHRTMVVTYTSMTCQPNCSQHVAFLRMIAWSIPLLQLMVVPLFFKKICDHWRDGKKIGMWFNPSKCATVSIAARAPTKLIYDFCGRRTATGEWGVSPLTWSRNYQQPVLGCPDQSLHQESRRP